MKVEMRSKERVLDYSHTIKIIERGEYGILSMITEENTAYGVPLNYVYYVNCIYFHCATGGYKLNSIRKSKSVSFCVVGETKIIPEKYSTNYESVIVSGKAKEILGEEKKIY